MHDNNIHDNNYVNFAPKGNIVATVPTGTGILILATKGVEVYNNNIINNQSIGTGIISYYVTQRPIKDKLYDPYPSAISIHDNKYERKPGLPIAKDPISMIVGSKFGENTPHILYDGIKNPKLLDAQGNWIAGQCIRIENNKAQSVLNLDVEHMFKTVVLTDNLKCAN